MNDFKYYEIVFASCPNNDTEDVNCDVWIIKCKRKPTIEEMEKFFSKEIKTAECDHVDIIEEVSLEYVFDACVNLKREEDIPIYETE